MDIDKMKSLVSAGKMGRRDFNQLSVAAGLTVAAGNSLFSATARATPKKGGHLKSAVGHGSRLCKNAHWDAPCDEVVGRDWFAEDFLVWKFLLADWNFCRDLTVLSRDLG